MYSDLRKWDSRLKNWDELGVEGEVWTAKEVNDAEDGAATDVSNPIKTGCSHRLEREKVKVDGNIACR